MERQGEELKSIKELIEMTQYLYNEAKQLGRTFNPEGWPIFNKEDFLEAWPEQVVTIDARNYPFVKDKKNTVLTFYMPDNRIFPRFRNLLREISLYQEYMGVAFPDMTVTADMDVELQKAIILCNHVFAAVLAGHGIKLLCNTRVGGHESMDILQNIPMDVMCISSFLGCDTSKTFIEAQEYIDKILILLPSKLVIYGKEDPFVTESLEVNGINYRYYPDMHTMSKLYRKGGSNGR